MPAEPLRFELIPHPANPQVAVRRIRGQVSRAGGEMRVRYDLEGDVDRLCVPESRAPGFADELWRHTCFELFVALRGAPSYVEFNFSPSGEWAAYSFSSYRERSRDAAPELSSANPRVQVRRAAGSLALEVMVPLEHLPPCFLSAPLAVGISAIMEANDGSLSYWALAHPGAKPDFHHRDAFVLEFNEIRN